MRSDHGDRLPWYFASVPLVSVLWWATVVVLVVGTLAFACGCLG
jgi:hypothetical protein